jgi:hypothetical protein
MQGDAFQQPERESRMYPAALQVILKGLVSWIIETSMLFFFEYLEALIDKETIQVLQLNAHGLTCMAHF